MITTAQAQVESRPQAKATGASCLAAPPLWSDSAATQFAVITREHGVDLATEVLYQRIMASSAYCDFSAAANDFGGHEQTASGDAVALVVPGAFYQNLPRSASAVDEVCSSARSCGFEPVVVPLDNFASLVASARRILDCLDKYHGRPATVISLSKGGADVKVALEQPGAVDAFRDVSCWVNLSGMIFGTPLITWIRDRRLRDLWVRALFGMRGYDIDFLHELERGPGFPLCNPLALPAGMEAIHVYGFPRLADLKIGLSRRCHRRVRHLGPNDGAGVLLADLCALPGAIYPVWGTDHYLTSSTRSFSELCRQIFMHLRVHSTVAQC